MRGLIIANDNFEDIELIATRDILIRASIMIDILSLNGSNMVKSKLGLSIKADIKDININFDKYDFLVIPGGNWVIQSMDNKDLIKVVVDIINEFNNKNKLISAICAPPFFLFKAGLLKDNNFTCYPGVEDFMKLKKREDKVFKFENKITANGPNSAILFALSIVKELKGHDVFEKVKKDIVFG